MLVINPLLPLIPSFGSNTKSFVVDQPHTTECPSQEILLFGSWVKTISVGALCHASHSTTLVVNTIGGAAFLSSLKVRVSCREDR